MTLSVEMTPPPFDPELGAALPAITEMIPAALTADLIPALRAGGPDAPEKTFDNHYGFRVATASSPSRSARSPASAATRTSRCSSCARPPPPAPWAASTSPTAAA